MAGAGKNARAGAAGALAPVAASLDDLPANCWHREGGPMKTISPRGFPGSRRRRLGLFALRLPAAVDIEPDGVERRSSPTLVPRFTACWAEEWQEFQILLGLKQGRERSWASEGEHHPRRHDLGPTYGEIDFTGPMFGDFLRRKEGRSKL
jgi:hypothetical protein